MTGPEDSHTGTRPISVAELLAKNGTIGSPPVGGRRRRRRGNSDSVTVAELTGEIPVISDDPPDARDEPDPGLIDTAVVAAVDVRPSGRNGRPGASTRPDAEPEQAAYDDAPADFARNDAAEADYDAHLQTREADPEPVEFRPRSRRPQYSRPPRAFKPTGSGAERMSPDPLDDLGHDDGRPDGLDDDKAATAKRSAKSVQPAEDPEADGSYRGSSLGPLFGGQSVADDIARRGRPSPEDVDLDDDADAIDRVDDRDEFDEIGERDETADEFEGSPLVRGAWIVGQCILAVLFGAGLFIAFDQLWKWNTIVALVLGVLVILGLAGGVRVVRKTEDIGSTLTAVAVGALVTFGPLALLQAS
ncbi:FUSC family protein [Mycolicibacterium sp. XJ870]